MGMTIAKEYGFEAAHHLPHHDGPCAFEHGHSYKVWFIIEGEMQMSEGFSDSQMVMDYGTLSEIVEPIIDQLDHSNLNQSAASLLGITRTTAEALALGLYEAVAPAVSNSNVGSTCHLVAVRVSETSKTWAEWRP